MEESEDKCSCGFEPPHTALGWVSMKKCDCTLLKLIKALEERVSRLERNALFPDADGHPAQGISQRGIQ